MSDVDGRAGLEQAVVANMRDGAAVIRAADGILVYTNDSWNRLFGYAPGELDGRHVSVVNAPSNQTPQERAQEIMGALERHGSWRGLMRNVRKDGSFLWTSAEVVTADDPEHGPIWMAVQREMTEYKSAEDTLRAAEERFRAAFEQSPVATALVDHNTRVTDANEAFCELSGYGRDALPNKPLADLASPEDATRLPADVMGAFGGDGAQLPTEHAIVTKSGDVLQVIMDARVARAADGHALCAIMTLAPTTHH